MLERRATAARPEPSPDVSQRPRPGRRRPRPSPTVPSRPAAVPRTVPRSSPPTRRPPGRRAAPRPRARRLRPPRRRRTPHRPRQTDHPRPLRARLGVSNQLASDLLRTLTTRLTRREITDDRRPPTALVNGLLDLAAFLEANPDVPVPPRLTVHHFPRQDTDADMRAEIDQIAALLGTPIDPDDGRTATTHLALLRPRRVPGRGHPRPTPAPATTPRPATAAASSRPDDRHLTRRTDHAHPHRRNPRRIIDALLRLRLQASPSTPISRAYPDRARPHHWRVYLTHPPARKEVTMPDDLSVIHYRCCPCGGTGLTPTGDPAPTATAPASTTTAPERERPRPGRTSAKTHARSGAIPITRTSERRSPSCPQLLPTRTPSRA